MYDKNDLVPKKIKKNIGKKGIFGKIRLLLKQGKFYTMPKIISGERYEVFLPKSLKKFSRIKKCFIKCSGSK